MNQFLELRVKLDDHEGNVMDQEVTMDLLMMDHDLTMYDIRLSIRDACNEADELRSD